MSDGGGSRCRSLVEDRPFSQYNLDIRSYNQATIRENLRRPDLFPHIAQGGFLMNPIGLLFFVLFFILMAVAIIGPRLEERQKQEES